MSRQSTEVNAQAVSTLCPFSSVLHQILSAALKAANELNDPNFITLFCHSLSINKILLTTVLPLTILN